MTQKEVGEKLGISQKQISKYEEIIDHIYPEVYADCKSHDLNRNDGINNTQGIKNSEPKILFPFTLSWFSQSGLYSLYIIYDYFKKDLRRFPCKWYNS